MSVVMRSSLTLGTSVVGIKVRAADFSVQPLVHDPAVVSGAILSKLGIITVIKVHLDCHTSFCQHTRLINELMDHIM